MREMAAVVLVLKTGKNTDVELLEQAYYPAFDQLSGPEVSGHLAKNRYVCFYCLLDGR